MISYIYIYIRASKKALLQVYLANFPKLRREMLIEALHIFMSTKEVAAVVGLQDVAECIVAALRGRDSFEKNHVVVFSFIHASTNPLINSIYLFIDPLIESFLPSFLHSFICALTLPCHPCIH
jgi:hypothetical protein